MTTGSWQFGGIPNGIASAKAWLGDDGYSNPPSLGQEEWNAYNMRHRQHRMTGAMVQNATRWDQVAVYQANGAYLGTFQDPDYVSWLHDSSVPTWTVPQAQAIIAAQWTANDEIALLAKLFDKIKGHDFHIGVSLAEVDKLAGTVLGAIRNITFGVADLARGRFARFARRFGQNPPNGEVVRKLALKDISGRLLETRYAIEPVIGDVFEAAKAFEAISGAPRSIRFRAKKRKRVVLSKSDGTWNKYWPDKVRDVRRQYIVDMYEEMDFFRQMGLMDPASIVWERIPYSFVLDWFIPIGTYLSLIGQVPGLTARYLRTTSLRQQVNGRASGTGSSAGVGRHVVNAGSFESENFYMHREIIGSLTIPRPTINVAGAFSGRRIINAVALGHQIIDKALNPDTRRRRNPRNAQEVSDRLWK